MAFMELPQKFRAEQVVVKGSGALMVAFPNTGQVMLRQEIKDFHLSCVRGHSRYQTGQALRKTLEQLQRFYLHWNIPAERHLNNFSAFIQDWNIPREQQRLAVVVCCHQRHEREGLSIHSLIILPALQLQVTTPCNSAAAGIPARAKKSCEDLLYSAESVQKNV